MRKSVVGGAALLVLGAFLVIAALMMWFWAPPRAERVPLNVDTLTYLTGSADKLDPLTGEVARDVPVWVRSRTQTDASKSDGDVVVFVSTTCVNVDEGADARQCLTKDDPRLITDAIDVFAADRHTGMAVNGEKYVGADATEHRGLVNKFPFDTEKKDYQYWDSLLGTTVTASYDSTVRLQGLKTYKFVVSVPQTEAEVADGVDGTYAAEKEMWVEPRTGSIVDQSQHEVRKLPDGGTILDMSLKFTDATVKSGVADGKSNIKTLDLLRGWVPITGGIVGLASLLLGAFLLLGRQPGSSRGGRASGRHGAQ